MFSALYTFVLHLLALFALPAFLYARLRHGKYKESLPCRFGLNFPHINKGDRFLIWVHAISMGETKAVVPLIRLIRRQMPDAIIVVSNITETGHKEAMKVCQDADYHVYLPFDLPYIVRPIIKQVKPDLVLITETDFWFHFQDAAKEVGAKIAVVNGKISLRSLKRYRILPWFTAPLFFALDLVCVQSETYKKRFVELGIPPDAIVNTGNLKLDDTYPELSESEKTAFLEKIGITKDDKVLVIGSTHDPEEKLLLSQLKKIWKKIPNLKVIIAPRHPERFKGVADYISKQQIPFALWSKNEKLTDSKNLLLVDAMGQLRQFYQLADIAIVAGSFTDKVGGHNLLEPSWYGKAVLYGPHVWAQKDLAELMRQKEAGRQVSIEKIAESVVELIADDEKRQTIGAQGKKIFQESKGATQKTWLAIRQIL